MFSPTVNAPLTWWPSASPRGTNSSYCSISALVRAPNSVRSSSVHQSTRLPSPSYLAPWSSKPWPISWPITAPMPP